MRDGPMAWMDHAKPAEIERLTELGREASQLRRQAAELSEERLRLRDNIRRRAQYHRNKPRQAAE